MKKIIVLFTLLLISTSMSAEEICYYSNFTSYKRLVDNSWTDWTDWREYYVEIVFDTDSNTITIYDADIVKVYKIHPIEYNAYLLGTTNDCGDFYKTWEK